MFERLFGWRKASKCKKLMQMVQCRLKLMKNKRCCIAKQLRDDVSHLLKHGHTQIAFQRVEQIIVDESTIQSYDLLDQFCQFLIFNLPYIRRHRDCPNDINEAASTLIYSSPRFGELPELIRIRKLFGERYGHRFVIAALELRPGNLVNTRLKDNLYIKSVPDDLKYQLLAEINSSLIKQAPLFLEYKPGADCEVQETPEEHERVVRDAVKYIDSGRHLSLYEMEDSMIYFDHIEEFVKHESLQDQRLFMFKSFGMVPLNNEAYYEADINLEDRKATEEQIVSTSISSCSHIHPKLPDYEELAAKFKALKSANLRIEN